MIKDRIIIRKTDYENFHKKWINNLGNSGEDKIRRIYDSISNPNKAVNKTITYISTDETSLIIKSKYKTPVPIYILEGNSFILPTGYELYQDEFTDIKLYEGAYIEIINKSNKPVYIQEGDTIDCMWYGEVVNGSISWKFSETIFN